MSKLRSELMKFFNKDKFLTELTDLLTKIDQEQLFVNPITDYCNNWIQGYFENTCDESDFNEQIEKLERDDIKETVLQFISAELESLKSQHKAKFGANVPSTESGSAGSSAQTTQAKTNLHDRIKTKAQSNAEAAAAATASNSQGPRKNIKILQKDEAKLQKASESIQQDPNNEDEGLLQDLEGKKKQRCKYFPNCKNEKTCPFIHPTEMCSFFPKCKFGGQCLNKHPECKFAKSCTRPDCFYEHPFPKKPAQNQLMQMIALLNGGKRKMGMGAGMGFGGPRLVKKPTNPANAQAAGAVTQEAGEETQKPESTPAAE